MSTCCADGMLTISYKIVMIGHKEATLDPKADHSIPTVAMSGM